jgi:hypothetical protein
MLLPVSLVAIAACVLRDGARGGTPRKVADKDNDLTERQGVERRCVIISGGKMSKGLT